jgi:hypothetical protein
MVYALRLRHQCGQCRRRFVCATSAIVETAETGRDSQERNPRSRSRTRFRFDLDRTHRWHSATRAYAFAATPHNSSRDALPCYGGGDSSASLPRVQRLCHDTRREAHDEKRPESVPAICVRFARSRRVRAVGVVGGAQLTALSALLRRPDPLMAAAFAAHTARSVSGTVKAASGAADHTRSTRAIPQTWFGVRFRSRSTLRNDCPAQIASTSCWRSSTGSRFCALALPNASESRRAHPGTGLQRQPVCQPAEVPWPASVTTGTLAGLHLPTWGLPKFSRRLLGSSRSPTNRSWVTRSMIAGHAASPTTSPCARANPAILRRR